MAAFRGFPLLFLLPLILGSFLSFSTAGNIRRKPRQVDFASVDLVDSDEEGQRAGTIFRGLVEEANFVTQPPPFDGVHYRRQKHGVGVTHIPYVGPKYRWLQDEADSKLSQAGVKYRGTSESEFITQPEFLGPRAAELSEETESVTSPSLTETYYRQLSEETDTVTAPSLTDTHYRHLSDEADSDAELPRTEFSYRELPEEKDSVPPAEKDELGFRRKILDEFKETIENIDQNFVENMSCEKVKEKMSKLVNFIRSSLDFIK